MNCVDDYAFIRDGFNPVGGEMAAMKDLEWMSMDALGDLGSESGERFASRAQLAVRVVESIIGEFPTVPPLATTEPTSKSETVVNMKKELQGPREQVAKQAAIRCDGESVRGSEGSGASTLLDTINAPGRSRNSSTDSRNRSSGRTSQAGQTVASTGEAGHE